MLLQEMRYEGNTLLLVVDANAIVARPLLTGSKWDEIRAAVATGSIELVVPDLAVQEAVSVFHKAHQVTIAAIRKLLRTTSAQTGQRLRAAIATLEAEQAGYEDLLRASLNDVGAAIVDLPTVSHAELTAKAIARRAPFDDSGGGYRDALHWHSLLEAAEVTEMPEVVLVSADRRAFGAPRLPELASELTRANSGVTLRVVSSVEAVEIPDLFSGNTDMFDQNLERQLLHQLRSMLDIHRDVSELVDPESEFDSADIRSLRSLSIDVASTREYYVTRDLQIRFECSAECLVDLTLVQIDENELDYREIRHAERWLISWTGEAFTSNHGSSVDDDIELRATSKSYLGAALETSA